MLPPLLPILLVAFGVFATSSACFGESPNPENWNEASQKRQKSQLEWYRRWRQNPPRRAKDAEALEQELLRNPDHELQYKILGKTPKSGTEPPTPPTTDQKLQRRSTPPTASTPTPEPIEIEDATPAREERFRGKNRPPIKREAR